MWNNIISWYRKTRRVRERKWEKTTASVEAERVEMKLHRKLIARTATNNEAELSEHLAEYILITIVAKSLNFMNRDYF